MDHVHWEAISYGRLFSSPLFLFAFLPSTSPLKLLFTFIVLAGSDGLAKKRCFLLVVF